MNRLPEPPARQPHATQAGQPTPDEALRRAAQIAAAVDDVYQQPTRYRDETPVPAVGTALPVPQPGRPPMSQRATDASALMLAGGVASLPVGGATALVLWALGQVDPVNLAIGAAAPTALALAIGSLLRSVGRAKQDMHTEHHHHYNGNVHQDARTVNSTTRGIWAHNRNQLPPTGR